MSKIPILLFTFSGFQMPAWFDLYSLDPSGQEDDRGIEKSKQYITNLIEQEINNGIDPSRIVLGGTYYHFLKNLSKTCSKILFFFFRFFSRRSTISIHRINRKIQVIGYHCSILLATPSQNLSRSFKHF